MAVVDLGPSYNCGGVLDALGVGREERVPLARRIRHIDETFWRGAVCGSSRCSRSDDRQPILDGDTGPRGRPAHALGRAPRARLLRLGLPPGVPARSERQPPSAGRGQVGAQVALEDACLDASAGHSGLGPWGGGGFCAGGALSRLPDALSHQPRRVDSAVGRDVGRPVPGGSGHRGVGRASAVVSFAVPAGGVVGSPRAVGKASDRHSSRTCWTGALPPLYPTLPDGHSRDGGSQSGGQARRRRS